MELLRLLLLLSLIIAPVSLFLHEVGHVIGARLMRATAICLSMGLGKKLWTFSFQNIDITIRTFFLWNYYTLSEREGSFDRYEKVMITLLGPLSNVGIATICWFVYHMLIQSSVIYLFFLFNLWVAVINFIPFKMGQKQTDGYTMMQLLQSKRDEK